ncbi:MAG: hypothetical protein ACYC9S_02035 [Leptospirales bacterium]
MLQRMIPVATFFLLIIALPLAAFSDDEYPVAYWGQTHIREAIQLHKSLSPSDFHLACNRGIHFLPVSAHKGGISKSTYRAWAHFANTKRLQYCRNNPKKTWYLLGEAPYFMLPSKPGAHK